MPNTAESLKNAGNALFKQGEYQAAIAQYNAALRCDPHCEAALFNKGLALKKLKDYAAALDAFTSVFTQNKKHTKAGFNKAAVLFELERYQDCLTACDEVLESDDTHQETKKVQTRAQAAVQAEACIDAGNAAYKERNHDTALTNYDEALTLNPCSIRALSNKGLVFKTLGKYPDALICFNAVITLNDKHVKALFHKADILMSLGKYKSALEVLYQALLVDENNKDILSLKSSCEEKIENRSAFITFCVADLKFDPKKGVKLLEFGLGFYSALTKFEELCLDTDLRSFIQAELQKVTGLLTYVNSRPGTLGSLPDDPEMKPFLSTLQERSTPFNSADISSYQGVYAGTVLEPVPDNVLCVDDSPKLYAAIESKIATHNAFQEAGLLNARPRCAIFAKQYHVKLATEIMQKIGAEANYYVIKAPDLSNGEGVIMVAKQDLEKVLRLLFDKAYYDNVVRKMMQQIAAQNQGPPDFNVVQKEINKRMFKKIGVTYDQVDSMRTQSHSPYFMVESYVSSKIIEVEGQKFDATIRVLFFMVRDNGNMRFVPLGDFWKLPKEAVSHSRQQGFKSDPSINRRVAKVDPQDYAQVVKQLEHILPPVFERMLHCQTDATHAECPLDSSKERKQLSAYYLQCAQAESAANRARFNEAHVILNQLTSQYPMDNKVFYIRGLTFLYQGKYQAAIANCQSANKILRNSKSYFIIAEAYAQLGDHENARANYQQCLQIAPNFPPAYRGLSCLGNPKQREIMVKTGEIKLGQIFHALQDSVSTPGVHQPRQTGMPKTP